MHIRNPEVGPPCPIKASLKQAATLKAYTQEAVCLEAELGVPEPAVVVGKGKGRKR